jgi:hypothetical protein
MIEVLNFVGFIENVKYKAYLTQNLPILDITNFNINNCESSGIIKTPETQIAYSKWVSPKRTRSYPFARIYNTYNSSKILTVIPVIKDEGQDGDLDKIQYSTFAWMNLLNIYIVLGYYSTAEKNKRPKQINKHKLTNQKFDNDFIVRQINEIIDYKQSALHWNMNLFGKHFIPTFQRALESYSKISIETGVIIHNQVSLEKYLQSIVGDFNQFRGISLIGSKNASERESKTNHELEYLSDGNKATFCIENYLGGTYYLTSDEILIIDDCYIIQESKNSSRSILPDLNDIQDGLFKLILYSNLSSLQLNGANVNFSTRLKLTGRGVIGKLTMPCTTDIIDQFINKNSHLLQVKQSDIIRKLNKEALNNPNLSIEINSNSNSN